jgi:hypothetical protein
MMSVDGRSKKTGLSNLATKGLHKEVANACLCNKETAQAMIQAGQGQTPVEITTREATEALLKMAKQVN